MTDRSLEERIRLRLLMEGRPVGMQDYYLVDWRDDDTNGDAMVDIADAARIAALEAEDSYRENAVVEALKMIIERPFPLKPKEER